MKNSNNSESAKHTLSGDKYELSGTFSEDVILSIAESILSNRIRSKDTISRPDDVKQYLKLHYRDLKHEVFSVIFLNTRHEILAVETLFTGTIDGASVYPREVVRKVIEHNAAAVIFSHNHPSHNPEPSQADKRITERLVKALALIDVRVLDHIIVGGVECVCFSEIGWI